MLFMMHRDLGEALGRFGTWDGVGVCGGGKEACGFLSDQEEAGWEVAFESGGVCEWGVG